MYNRLNILVTMASVAIFASCARNALSDNPARDALGPK